MFRASRPIFRSVHTDVHTTIGSVFVLFRSRAPYVVAGPSREQSLGPVVAGPSREQSLGPATTYGAGDLNSTDTEPMVV